MSVLEKYSPAYKCILMGKTIQKQRKIIKTIQFYTNFIKYTYICSLRIHEVIANENYFKLTQI